MEMGDIFGDTYNSSAHDEAGVDGMECTEMLPAGPIRPLPRRPSPVHYFSC